MSEFTAQLDRVRQAQQALMFQFRDKPKFQGLQKAFGDQYQEIELMLIDVYVLTQLDNATNAQLDGLGDLVGELRLGRNDTDYKAAIRGRIRRNKQIGVVEDILTTMNLVFPTAYEFTQLAVVAFILYMKTGYTPSGNPSLSQVNRELQKTRGGGIGAHLQYADVDSTNVFTFADGDVPQSDVNLGFSNDGQTTGGFWSDLVE